MENNLTLCLEALASSGCIVPSEMRCAINISLKYKKRDAGLRSLSLWGRLFTAGGKDYLLAEGVKSVKLVKRKLVFDTRYYFSQNGAVWLDLQSPTDEQFELCKKIRGPFRGDPSHLYFVPDPPPPPAPPAPETTVEPAFIAPSDPSAKAEEEEEGSATEADSATDAESEAETEETETIPDAEPQVETDEEGPDPELNPEGSDAESAEPPAPKGQEVGELVRLASLMRWVDEDCGVVPIGGMVLDAQYNLLQNVVFPGVEFGDKLDRYGHLFRGYEKAPLSKDITGFWSIQQQPLTNDVTIRSLLWPGYHMYYSGSTYDFGSLYFGWGEKNWDIAFMIN